MNPAQWLGPNDLFAVVGTPRSTPQVAMRSMRTRSGQTLLAVESQMEIIIVIFRIADNTSDLVQMNKAE